MKQIGEYLITHPNISKGAFASIHKGEHKYTRKTVAIKEIKVKNTNNLKNYVIRELEIHKNLNHPNIVKIYDIIISNPENAVYMIMEYCEYGDLQKFQNKTPFNEKYIQCYMIQLRDALKYLHNNNIVHRDLKPQNILLISPLTIKITDFGLARNITDDIHKMNNIRETELEKESDLFSTYCGSPIYMSPELLNKQHYNSKSDLWSVGIILYELITGYPPFLASNLKQLINKVNSEPVNLDKIDKTLISPECFDLLKQLLNANKNTRMEWEMFFTHQWFDINMVLRDDNLIIENPLDYDLLNKVSIPIKRSNSVSITRSNASSNLKFSNSLKIGQLSTANPTFSTNTNTNTNTNSNANSNVSIIANYDSNSSATFSSNIFLSITNSIPNSIPNSILDSILDSKEGDSKGNNNDTSEIFSSSFPKSKIKSTITKQFTFNLKSSQFSDNILPKSQVSDVNLSDLEQDDILEINYKSAPTTTMTTMATSATTTTTTKPININTQNNTYRYQTRNQDKDKDMSMSSSNSSSLSSTPKQNNMQNSKAKKNDESPRSIINALKFIKETYDYLSSDTKSL